MIDVITGAVSGPYSPDDQPDTVVCCDVEVRVRVTHGRGLDALTQLLAQAERIATDVDLPF